MSVSPNPPALEPMNDYTKMAIKTGTHKFYSEYIEEKNKLKELDGYDDEFEDSDDEPLKDSMYNKIDDKELVGIIPKYEVLSPQDNIEFIRCILMHYNTNTLHSVLGQFLVDNYVKIDKATQSLHLTDSSRNSFIIAKLQESLKKTKWERDPRGTNVQKYIIDPMLRFIGVQIEHHYNKILKSMRKEALKGACLIGTDTEFNTCYEIMRLCMHPSKKESKPELRKNIMEYIAPNFHLNKTLQLEE